LARRRIIDPIQLEQLASLQCTQPEIAAFFGVSLQAVEKQLAKPEFREPYEKGLKTGLISLRRAQMQAALAGNATMLIWLGKQLLGQSDKLQHAGAVEYTKRIIGVNIEDI
jgi:hypothetical protein